MKRKLMMIVFCSLMLAGTNAFSQFREVPAQVTNSFKDKYPEATDVAWDDKISSFQAKFKWNDAMYEARFNKEGVWQETEKSITMEELPASVRDAFQSTKFRDWTLQSVAMIEKSNGGTEYRIYVSNNTVKRKYLYYNEAGKLLKEAYKL